MVYRPVYENSSDLANEAAVAHAFGSAARLSVTKMPALCAVDYEAHEDSTLTAYLEIKCRRNTRLRYSTFFISKIKIDTALAMAQKNNVAFVLVIRWTDGIYYHVLDDVSGFEVHDGGRWDRGDPKDIEPLYHIPVELFHRAA